MANFVASNAGPTLKQNKIKPNLRHGRIRYFESSYIVPASAGPGIGDTITWGDLPIGARVLGHLSTLDFAAGAASSTLNLGDASSAARHLAATSVAAAGSAVPKAQQTAGASFETSDASAAATNNCTLISTVAGAALGASQLLTLRVAYVCD